MIATCPKCHEEVLLPGGVQPESRVRCPLCREEYLLADAMSKLPPPLILVDPIPVSGGGGGYGVGYGGVSGQDLLADESGGELSLAPADDGGVATAEEELSVGFGPAVAKSKPTGIRPTARKSRPQKGMAGEMIKIVLGGVAGLVIAQLIIWWLPTAQPNDPFGLAPKVASYSFSRWIVPKVFWPTTVPVAPADQKGAGAAGGPGTVDTKAPADGSLRAPGSTNWDEVIKPQGKTGAKAKKTPAKPASNDNLIDEPLVADFNVAGDSKPGKGGADIDLAPVGPTAPKKPANDDLDFPLDAKPSPPTNPNANAKPAVDAGDKPGAEKPSIEKPGVEKPTQAKPAASEPSSDSPTDSKPDSPSKPDSAGKSDAATKSESPGKTVEAKPVGTSSGEKSTEGAVGLVNPARVPAVRLGQTIAAAEAATEAWTEAAEEKNLERRRKLADDLYTSMALVGEAITLVDPDDAGLPVQIESANELVGKLLGDDTAARYVERRGAVWIEETGRQLAGAAIVGTVKEIKASGPLFEMVVTAQGKEPRDLKIVSVKDPREVVRPMQRALVLGLIVDKPTEKLGGYTGENKPVVFGSAVISAAP